MNGDVFVWNADDWLKLRQSHRIVGNLIGTLGCLPRQDILLGLPVALMKEEVRLLLDKRLAQVVQYEGLTKLPSADLKEKFEQFRKESYLEQVQYFQVERKRQITNMVDIIVEGKRRKLMGLSTKKPKGKRNLVLETENSTSQYIEIDRDALIQQEFNKIVPITEEMALIQTPTACPWLKEKEAGRKITQFSFPETPDEILRSKVFSDLWSKGHFISTGQKFGGTFLVYPGDPMKFHAQYIVLCRDQDQPMTGTELAAICRLGTSVRKSIVLATLDNEGEINYQTIQWTP